MYTFEVKENSDRARDMHWDMPLSYGSIKYMEETC
jgi:hypothetical protein